jgi:hypothetical protein
MRRVVADVLRYLVFLIGSLLHSLPAVFVLMRL